MPLKYSDRWIVDRDYTKFHYAITEKDRQMARYYGTIQGARGPTSRLGSKKSGLHVSAQSFNGDILVSFYQGDDDTDMVHISARQHGGGRAVDMYCGRVDNLLAADGLTNMVKSILKYNPKLRRQIVLEYATDALKDRARGPANDDQ